MASLLWDWFVRYYAAYVVTAGLAFIVVQRASWLRAVRRAWARLARWGAVTIGAGAALSLGLSVFMSRSWTPLPAVHDEFSYLLAADTFAHGRLTNPPHPMWQHFETIHVLHQPTYMSKYPPGQGLSLALGQVLWKPILGAWIGTALAAGATAWMLLAFVPPRWALLGGILAAIHPQMVEWGRTYWGGGLAVLGGALVVGAVGRAIKAPRVTTGIVLGIGVAILANTRSYEGLLLTLGSAGLALALLRDRGKRPPMSLVLRRVVWPAALVLAATFAWMGYYNWRVTGHALRMPYTVYHAAYGSTPLFSWQTTFAIPVYRNRTLWEFWAVWAFDYWAKNWITLEAILATAQSRWHEITKAMFPAPRAALVLLLLPVVHLRSPRTRKVEILLIFFAAGTFAAAYFSPAYLAPAAALVVLIYVQCLRCLSVLRIRRYPIGQFLLPMALLVFGLMSYKVVRGYVIFPSSSSVPNAWASRRAAAIAEVEKHPGNHLLVVRYRPGHYIHEEWVYNAADIDAAPVVFARDLGPARNRELLRYFSTRKVWLLEPDSGSSNYALTAYPEAAAAGDAKR